VFIFQTVLQQEQSACNRRAATNSCGRGDQV